MKRDSVVVAVDGRELAATIWRAESDCCLIINSAMGVRRQFYKAFAGYLHRRGFQVITYDYRGIGDSAQRQPGGDRVRLYEWGETDFESVIRHARSALKASRIGVIGHSVGSQVIGLAESNRFVDAILMVASQSGYWGHWSGFPRAAMFLVWYALLPAIAHGLGQFPGKFAGGNVNLPKQIALDWARCGRDPQYIRGRYARDSDRFFAQVRAPILALSITDDRYAPRASTEALLSWYENAQRTLVELTPASLGVRNIRHFGWFRQRIAEKSWQQAVDWLGPRLGIATD